MDAEFNYKSLFDQAVQRIRGIRDPHSTRPETIDLKWDEVRKQVLFDFGGTEFEKYSSVLDAAQKISFSILSFIIQKLSEHYGKPLRPISVHFDDAKMSDPVFTFVDDKEHTVLFFKNIEECSFWKLKGSEPKAVAEIMKKHGADNCKYIYLMYDYAYLQIVGHNDDETDPGRGYNVYSIGWFFESYFGEEEYGRFLTHLKAYNQKVESYLGYILVRSLTPNTLINFRKVTEHAVITFPYAELLSEMANNYYLHEIEYGKIKKQFFDDKAFSVLLGSHDFAESLITAEWLYSSMKKASAIDLTTVGMGYLKAVEQLLYELICLHKDNGLLAKKDYSVENRDLPDLIPLSTENIEARKIDFSIGSMANFVKSNFLLFRSDLRAPTKKYIREFLFNFANLRNGYFHKHNIHDWSKIDEIRGAAFRAAFLLIGAFDLDNEAIKTLGAPSTDAFTDYAKLCEYVNYHSGEIFYLVFDYGEEIGIAMSDPQPQTINDEYIQYTGVYFKELRDNGRVFRFREENLPKEIHIGKFVFAQTEMIGVTPVKVKKVYENGKYLGPSIAEEDSFDY